MNAIWIVLPILTLLMFELGLTLQTEDFKLFRKRPRPIIAGLAGQIILLPMLAFALGHVFQLEPLFFIGIILIACSPGGSSSNIFSMIAKGDVALSVSLTACSSIITLFTIPVIMEFATHFVDSNLDIDIHLPVGSLIMQNLVLMLLPIVAGIFTKRYRPQMAERIHKILSKTAFPALILLATIFFIQHHATITGQFGKLGLCISILILLAMGGGVVLSKSMRLNRKEQRTLIIEIGMQNAAQAIAVASSPFVFNNDIIAIPAIIYALVMNVILLIYGKDNLPTCISPSSVSLFHTVSLSGGKNANNPYNECTAFPTPDAHPPTGYYLPDKICRIFRKRYSLHLHGNSLYQ